MGDDQHQDEDSIEVPFGNLYSALVSCFGVIICGYIAGRVGIIKEQHTQGLATFVGTFSLPCLIFISLASVDFSSVNWYFILSVFISKAIIFACVLFITLLVTRPINLGKSGLFAIFCTQSNDFAIGTPIISTVYGSYHKDFVNYLYLLTPVNLVVLNPIGFTLMEISRNRSARETSSPRSYLPLRVITSIATNPIVFMTALGIAWNFIFARKVPDALEALLTVFSSAFNAPTLFLLGFRMVGSARQFKGEALMVPIFLIGVKELVLPLLTREVSSLVLTWAQVPAEDILAFSTYGFLYGTLPSAAVCFVYATNYGVEVRLIATAMVACTFVSAPLMFISAKMVSISHLSPSKTLSSLTEFELDLSLAGIVACVILLSVFTFRTSAWSAPQKLTMCLVISQLFGCIGTITGHLPWPYSNCTAYFLTNLGDISARILTACLAICLAFMECRDYASVNHLLPIFYGIASGIPFLLIGVANLLGVSIPSTERTTLAGSTIVETIDIFVLFISLIVCVIYMVLKQRYRRRYARYSVYSRESSVICVSAQRSEDVPTPQGEEQPVLAGTFVLDSSSGNDDSHPVHHMALVFFLVFALFISLALHIWNVVDERMTGVYLELAFLEVFFTRGQSLIVLFIFGLDIIPLLQPFCRRVMKTFYQGETITLPNLEEIPSETQHLCDTTYQIEACQTQIIERDICYGDTEDHDTIEEEEEEDKNKLIKICIQA